MSKGDRKMNANHSVHMSLKADNPDHAYVWKMIQSRDREKFPIISDYIVEIMIHAQKKETGKEEKHRDFKHFREPTGEIAGKNLEEILRKQESILKEKSDEGLKLYQEIREMEELLQKEPEVEKEEPAAQAERMKKMLEDMIRSCMQGTSTDR